MTMEKQGNKRTIENEHIKIDLFEFSSCCLL